VKRRSTIILHGSTTQKTALNDDEPLGSGPTELVSYLVVVTEVMVVVVVVVVAVAVVLVVVSVV
jgi:hypothetical protein